MPNVTCPSCGERGKIGSSFIGSRLKCKKCGSSFLVSAPVANKTASRTAAGSAGAIETPRGIEVEGLDASSWSLSTEVGGALKAEVTTEPDQPAESGSPFVPAETSPGSPHEYKLLTPKEKFFEGKFDLPRLEEALNYFGRQGLDCQDHVDASPQRFFRSTGRNDRCFARTMTALEADRPWSPNCFSAGDD